MSSWIRLDLLGPREQFSDDSRGAERWVFSFIDRTPVTCSTRHRLGEIAVSAAHFLASSSPVLHSVFWNPTVVPLNADGRSCCAAGCIYGLEHVIHYGNSSQTLPTDDDDNDGVCTIRPPPLISSPLIHNSLLILAVLSYGRFPVSFLIEVNMRAFITAIFTVFCVVLSANAHSPGIDESTIPTLAHRTQETCGDNADLYIIGDTASFLGVAALIFPFSEPSTVPLFALRGTGTPSAYFYTTNATERDEVLAQGWQNWTTTGYIYPSQICGSVPLYRLHYIAANTDYIYTTSTTTRDNAILNQGFTYEGIAGYVMQLSSFLIGAVCS
ncbi:hypothetical protein MSAN_01594300 [Mycena sanguinolenta]|uniref:DUF5648 domain-containing protein n=1 Tax=Mycena sanguinolenta TaxID=230812 RepID=A0A8H6Y085_9AGAR|nr:hypothetical protein MSAN_01594300 [Mycena sanguinolenta]